MAQIDSGIRRILTRPFIYSSFRSMISRKKNIVEWVHNYIRPEINNRILDIGCGTADILNYLPLPVEYVGYDVDQAYTDAARKKFGDRGTFILGNVNGFEWSRKEYFDVVMAIGVLHHLGDEEALALFKMAYESLREKGSLLTADPVYFNQQSRIARWIMSKDRGRNVRTEIGYRNLATAVFRNVNTHIRHDFLRIPYAHLLMECTR